MATTPTNFLSIDELRLDVEIQNQPSLYLEYSRKLADARKALDDASAEHDILLAESTRDIRKKPLEYKLSEKPTESAIKDTAMLMPEVQDAAKEIRIARHHLDVCQGAVTALEHRKRALTLMVELRGQEYFGTPKVSYQGKTAVESESKDRTRRLGQRREDRGD